jgi:predicted DNA binding CopG/RHH family protein
MKSFGIASNRQALTGSVCVGHQQTKISLRMSGSLWDGIRQQANKLDVPYQSLMQACWTEKLCVVNGQTQKP